MPSLREWLRNLKENWNLLATSATWIAAVAASVILSPDAIFNDEASLIPWMSKLAVFIIAVLIGITFLLTGKLNRKKHSWYWGLIATIFLVFSVWGVLRYYKLTYSLTCTCNGQKVVKGEVYQDSGMMDFSYPKGFGCLQLCTDFKDSQGKVRPEKVWTEDSINEFRSTLVYTYIFCFPLIAITIISVSQAVFCYQNDGNNTKTKASTIAEKKKSATLKKKLDSEDIRHGDKTKAK